MAIVFNSFNNFDICDALCKIITDLTTLRPLTMCVYVQKAFMSYFIKQSVPNHVSFFKASISDVFEYISKLIFA